MVKLLEHYFSHNPHIKSELRTIKVRFNDLDLTFCSDNGVFSKDKIDFGSRTLIEELIKNCDYNFKTVLDVGCGYGFIGISIAKKFNCKVDMIDVNERAIHLTKKNISINKVEGNAFVSNIYENVKDKYDLIVTNPPIRAGKEVVLKILKEASMHLNPDGELWFVIRKDQGAKSIKKELENNYECLVVAKNKGFYVIKSKKR